MGLNVEYNVEDADVKHLLQFLKGQWLLIIHNEMHDWGQELQALAQKLSPEDKLRGIDSRRRPTKDRLAFSWGFDVDTGGGASRLEIFSSDERAHLILFPTSAKDDVTPRGDDPMFFYFEDGRAAQAWSINKPATPGQPVHLWAIEEFGIDAHVMTLARKLAEGVL